MSTSAATSDGTDGVTSTTGPGMTATTVAPTTSAGGTGTGAGSSSSGAGTSSTSGGTTGGVECMIDLPDPGSCNKLVGGGGRPGGLKGPASDPEPFGASSGGFIQPPGDLGGPGCDLFAQDCPDGQKCNAFANDGGSSWNATGCFPVDPNPDPIGAPCTAEGSGVSGIDSCVPGAMCWGIDTQTGEGTCVELCTCSIEQPICTTPNTTCVISNDATLVLCLPVCDPLDAAACGSGDVCVSNPSGDGLFICVIDASGDSGQTGDPCEFINACGPAHACVSPEFFPGCDLNSGGCCAPFCDLDAVACPPGSECLPWFEQGMAPKCFEDVGVCGAM